MSRFRRPAMLTSERAESIVGAENPETTLHFANTAARALLGLTDDEFHAGAVHNLVETIAENGVDVVAALWEEQPAYTLAGAFWRLFLFQQWYHRDPQLVEQRFTAGVEALQVAGRGGAVERLSISSLIAEIDRLFRAEVRIEGTEWGRLTPLLERTAVAMWTLATGASVDGQWIESDRDELATLVTRRAQALASTAEELKLAADRDAAGNLI